MPNLKHHLHSHCLAYVQERITAAEESIRSAQHSANEETKSSAGDKYETGRAMAQLEIEKNSVQLAEAKKLKQVMEHISPDQITDVIQTGSVVITNQGNFYIAISAGQFIIDGRTYFIISPASPIAQKLMWLKVHDHVDFQGKNFTILGII